jgi:hypothetical protein
MISHPRTHKGAVLIAAYVMFSCVAALLSVNLTSPTSAALGTDWQCSRFALVFTTCTPVRAHETVSTGCASGPSTPQTGHHAANVSWNQRTHSARAPFLI